MSDSARPSRGFDTTANCAPLIPKIFRTGYEAVGRYYSFSTWKNLSKPEAEAISAARDQIGQALRLWTVWEANGNIPASFTGDNGQRHAQTALQQARQIGQPEGSGLYFAVDYPAHAGEVIDYFRAVQGTIGTLYRIGVYADGDVCEGLLNGGLVSLTWEAGASAWPGSKTFMTPSIQQFPTSEDPGLGIQIDKDAVLVGEAGMWSLQAEPKVYIVPTYPGDAGPRVVNLQFRVGAPQTGVYDAATRLAVAAYQRSHHLIPDGLAGPLTWGSLLAP